MKIRSCQVNHLENPLGFQLLSPTFHWVTEDCQGKKETESRIIVRQGEKVVLDTGFAPHDSLAVPLAIKLAPRTRYTWTVTVRTDAGEEAVSPEQFFETGKMDEPWAGAWIHSGAPEKDKARHPVFSRSFTAEKEIASASTRE